MPRHAAKSRTYRPVPRSESVRYGQHSIGRDKTDRPSLGSRDYRYAKVASQIHDKPSSMIVWTVDRQKRACDEGYFLHRAAPDNHVDVIPIGKRYANAREIIAHLLSMSRASGSRVSHEVARPIHEVARPTGCANEESDFARLVLAFITQQDVIGYVYAWDRTVCNYSIQLGWYKRLKLIDAQAKAEAVRKRAATASGIHHFTREEVDALTSIGPDGLPCPIKPLPHLT